MQLNYKSSLKFTHLLFRSIALSEKPCVYPPIFIIIIIIIRTVLQPRILKNLNVPVAIYKYNLIKPGFHTHSVIQLQAAVTWPCVMLSTKKLHTTVFYLHKKCFQNLNVIYSYIAHLHLESYGPSQL